MRLAALAMIALISCSRSRDLTDVYDHTSSVALAQTPVAPPPALPVPPTPVPRIFELGFSEGVDLDKTQELTCAYNARTGRLFCITLDEYRELKFPKAEKPGLNPVNPLPQELHL